MTTPAMNAKAVVSGLEAHAGFLEAVHGVERFVGLTAIAGHDENISHMARL